MNLLVAFAFFAAIFAVPALIAFAVTKLIGHRGGFPEGGEGEGEGGDGGGGGWTDKPSGRPPGGGGPDRNIDQMFHEVCDAIGKTIKIEKKDKEKVLQ